MDRKHQLRNGRRTNKRETIVDEYHNLKVPSCQLVVGVTLDVIPEAAAELDIPVSDSQPSLFGSLVRRYFLEHHRTKSISAKSKKKRRKKNKQQATKVADASDSSVKGESSSVSAHQEEMVVDELLKSEEVAPIEVAAQDSSVRSPRTDDDGNVRAPHVVIEWLDRIQRESTESTHQNRTLEAFCRYLAAQNDANVAKLATKDISHHLGLTKCVPCKAASEGYWQSTGMPMHELGIEGGGHHCQKTLLIEPRTIEIPSEGRTIPVIGNIDDDWDRAFDYHAMEEGRAVEAATDKMEESAILTFQPIPDSGGKVHNIQVSTKLNIESVERLLSQIILPCGLPRLEHPNAVLLTDAQYHQIIKLAETEINKNNAVLQTLGEQRSVVNRKFNEIREKAGGDVSFDVLMSAALRECDGECDDFLDSIADVLIKLTALADCLPGAAWAHFRMQSLWKSFCSGVDKVMEQSLLHEAKSMQLANRPGVVPQLFLSRAHRSSFLDLIRLKCTVWNNYWTELFTTLTDDEEYPQGPTFLRRLQTNRPFVDIALPSQKLEEHDLDEVMSRLVRSSADLVRTILSSHLSILRQEQINKTRLVAEILGEADQKLVGEFKLLKPTHADQSRWMELWDARTALLSNLPTLSPVVVHESERNARVESDDSLKFTEDCAEEVAVLAKRRRELVRLVTTYISLWRCVRLMRSQTRTAPTMPLKLVEWMTKSELAENGNNVCHGKGGKRRLGGVLACLVYRWLTRRCNEWHAELTQLELLESMDDGFDVTNNENTLDTTRSSKSSKKKKKRKGAISENGERTAGAGSLSAEETHPAPVDLGSTALPDAVITDAPDEKSLLLVPPGTDDAPEARDGLPKTRAEYVNRALEPGVDEYKEEPETDDSGQIQDPSLEMSHLQKIEAHTKRSLGSSGNELDSSASDGKVHNDGRSPNGTKKSGTFSEMRNDKRTDPEKSQLQGDWEKKTSKKKEKMSGKISERSPQKDNLLPLFMVGVEARDGSVIPAEEFLLVRLVAILKEGSTDRSGNPIVRL